MESENAVGAIQLSDWLGKLEKKKQIGKFTVPSCITQLPCGCQRKPTLTPIPGCQIVLISEVAPASATLTSLKVGRPLDSMPFRCEGCGEEIASA